MSGPYPVPGGATPIGRRWRRKHSIGCLGSLVLLVVLAFGLQVLYTPWAFHIGGRLTLLGWTGVAGGTAPNGGGTYAVRIKLSPDGLWDRNCSQTGCDNVHGSITVCTKAGEYTYKNMDGKVGGWTSVNNQRMRVGASGAAGGSPTAQIINLDGIWHGPEYDATDEGYLVFSFQPDGTPRPATDSAHTADAVRLAFRPGDFSAACRKVRG